MYRTFCALFLLIGIIVLYCYLSQFYSILKTIAPYICIFIFLVLYILSYRKQTVYITKRVDANRPHL